MNLRPIYLYAIEKILPLLTLGILGLYLFAYFFEVPYIGFSFNQGTRIIDVVFPVGQSPQSIQAGDRILKINGTPVEQIDKDQRRMYFPESITRETLQLTVQRSGQILEISYLTPGPNLSEVIYRTVPIWFPFVFWILGTLALLLLRPKDSRWALLVIFNYLTAVWLMTGFISSTRVYYSSLVMRSAIWLSVPVLLHLHWVFPKPLKPLKPIWMLMAYLSSGVMVILTFWQLLPTNLYALGFLLALLGSLGLLGLHILMLPDWRRDLSILGIAVGLAALPMMLLAFSTFLQNSFSYSGIVLFSLIGIPGAYIFIIYRRQLGGLELRANRAASLYFFAVLLLTAMTPLIMLLNQIFDSATNITVMLLMILLSGILTAVGFPAFQRLLDRYYFKMPLPLARLMEVYSNRIITSLEIGDLSRVLRDEVLSSMLIRQAALLRLEDLAPGKPQSPQGLEPVLCLNLDPVQLPAPDQIPQLLVQNGNRSTIEPPQAEPYSWVRLALPLQAKGRLIGAGLFGRRDPDDDYTANEITLLQSLMNQTALALINIDQARRLRTLYQTNIERQEAERRILAEELRDDVLHHMALLKMSLEPEYMTPQFTQAYQAAVQHIREIVSGLRPGMLYYGLYSALEELVDEAPHQLGSPIPILLNIPPSEQRYDPDIELHLYRIVQQACQNAVKHSQAAHIIIHGQLNQDNIDLWVEDDGVGFQTDILHNLNKLLVNKHFGLAGLYERAALIHGEVNIHSQPNQGTRVQIHWESPGNDRSQG